MLLLMDKFIIDNFNHAGFSLVNIEKTCLFDVGDIVCLSIVCHTTQYLYTIMNINNNNKLDVSHIGYYDLNTHKISFNEHTGYIYYKQDSKLFAKVKDVLK